jgi:acetylglutamate kinase
MKTFVIKYGGAAMTDAAVRKNILKTISETGKQLVLVHGGGPEINSLAKRLGVETRFSGGLRVTDEAMMECVLDALCGKVNKGLAAELCALGADAVGIAGSDGGLFQAKLKDASLGLVGEVTACEPRLVRTLLEAGFIPVVSPVAANPRGGFLNVNADEAAAALAAALKADALILMTDTPGVLLDKDKPESLVKELDAAGAAELKARGIISGGMIPKTEACIAALEGGALAAHIIDGRNAEALKSALEGGAAGTRFCR